MDNRVICKVRQTQHQTLELDHHRVRFLKIPANKNIRIQGGVKLRKPSI
jgi:hypothetical protein